MALKRYEFEVHTDGIYVYRSIISSRIEIIFVRAQFVFFSFFLYSNDNICHAFNYIYMYAHSLKEIMFRVS